VVIYTSGAFFSVSAGHALVMDGVDILGILCSVLRSCPFAFVCLCFLLEGVAECSGCEPPPVCCARWPGARFWFFAWSVRALLPGSLSFHALRLGFVPRDFAASSWRFLAMWFLFCAPVFCRMTLGLSCIGLPLRFPGFLGRRGFLPCSCFCFAFVFFASFLTTFLADDCYLWLFAPAFGHWGFHNSDGDHAVPLGAARLLSLSLRGFCS